MRESSPNRGAIFSLVALACVLAAFATVLACSNGSSPTEPSAPESAAATTGNANAGDDGSSGDAAGAEIRVEKSTEGEDADSPPGPSIAVGDPVQWRYEITNTGGVDLVEIAVTDNQEGKIDCPKTELAPKESMTCKASGIAEKGQYKNVASVDGVAPDKTTAHDKDRSHYFGAEKSGGSLRIEKSTNGEDADSPPGPSIPEGDPVEWVYEITNTGKVVLVDIEVTDDQGVNIDCPSTELEPGENMTCTASGVAVEGPYENLGRVVGTEPGGSQVHEKDRSHYTGECVGSSCEDEDSESDSDSNSDSDSGEDSDGDGDTDSEDSE